jgi:short-subunit dehydrogenase
MQRYLITGASRGIGRAIAVRLAEKGKLIFLHGRDHRALNKTSQAINSRNGKPRLITADLRSLAGVEKLLAEVGKEKIHLLVNNAGIAVVKPVGKITFSEWQTSLFLSVSVPFLLVQRLLPQMPSGSSIVNILSVAATQGFPNWSSYCAGKFALDGFSKCLREEVRGKGIRIISVYPKATSTDLWKQVPGKWPGQKMMKPEEVAEAVYYAVNRPPSTVIEDIYLGNVAGNL